MLELDNN